MPKIDKQIIDKILEAAKIEEVIQDCLGSYGSGNRAGLKKTGVRYKALCPFHDDHSLGSFIVYPKGNCYKCFSCGAKGGVVEFLMEHEKLSYPDAIRWLGKKYIYAMMDAHPGIMYQMSDNKWTMSKKEVEAFEQDMPFAPNPDLEP